MTLPQTSLLTFDEWTLRIRPVAGGRLLLLLHGWTGDENSMWAFARSFPSESYLLAPRAPHPAASSGYSWRRPAVHEGWPTVDLLRPSAAALIDLLDGFARAYGLDASSVDVAGFSQGAAMTLALGLLYPARVRKMAILAGFTPMGAEEVAAAGQFSGKKVFVTHGRQDQIIPIAQAQRTVELVENLGGQVLFCESEAGHKVGAECFGALESYLRT
jgi:phospholipase/carboxylesterase